MHINSKKMAVGGVLMALAVLCIVLSGVLKFNTLFLLAASSFFVGVMIREGGFAAGVAFYVGTAALGFLLAPHKLYCITFVVLGLYILGSEWIFLLVARWEKSRQVFLWVGKFLIFNLLYLPVLFFFPRLIFVEGLSGVWLWAAAAVGQILFWIYDRAYEYFLIVVWERFRTRLALK